MNNFVGRHTLCRVSQCPLLPGNSKRRYHHFRQFARTLQFHVYRGFVAYPNFHRGVARRGDYRNRVDTDNRYVVPAMFISCDSSGGGQGNGFLKLIGDFAGNGLALSKAGGWH